MTASQSPLDARWVKSAALKAGFDLVGLARAEALSGEALRHWLAQGFQGDMEWMGRRLDERLDPRNVLPNAQTVIALARGYHRPVGEKSPIARYARGRDYHNIHRSALRRLRRAFLDNVPGIETYACVDTGIAMEKVWAERAGLGWIGKNGCLIHPKHGSWLTLSVFYIDRAVDAYDEPGTNLCGDCDLCLRACPTSAFPSPGVVDAKRCLSYQSIENPKQVPEEIRRGFRTRAFGCDVCQEVCPFVRQGAPFRATSDATKEIATLSCEDLAAMDKAQFDKQSLGSAVSRPGHDGMRRNALLAIGAGLRKGALPLVTSMCQDPVTIVAEAAQWAKTRLTELPSPVARGADEDP